MPALKKLISFLLSFAWVLFTMNQPDPPGTPVAVNENATNPYIMQYGKPLVSAHRSGAGIAPENTLMAFQACLEAEDFAIDVFEFDVQLTKDGELVLLHNSSYDSTSNAAEAFGKSNIRPINYTLAQLQALNLGENFSIHGEKPYQGLRGEAIPQNLRVLTADEILRYVEEHAQKEYRYIIEIKLGGANGRRAADKLYALLLELDLLDRTIIGSFFPGMPAYFDAHCPGMQRSASILECLQFYYHCRMDADLSAKDIRYVALQLPFGLNVMPFQIDLVDFGTRQLLNYAHKYNIAVQYWTVNTQQDVQYLLANGADAIMTDQPDMVYTLVNGQ